MVNSEIITLDLSHLMQLCQEMGPKIDHRAGNHSHLPEIALYNRPNIDSIVYPPDPSEPVPGVDHSLSECPGRSRPPPDHSAPVIAAGWWPAAAGSACPGCADQCPGA